MQLKQDISSVDFFKAVDNCTGDVLLRTAEGDVLNLRSRLCRYIFAVAAVEKDLFDNIQVECKIISDYEVLKEFLRN